MKSLSKRSFFDGFVKKTNGHAAVQLALTVSFLTKPLKKDYFGGIIICYEFVFQKVNVLSQI